MKKRTVLAGLGVLAVLGLVFVVGAALDLDAPSPHGMMGKHTLSENSTGDGVWGAMFDKRIMELGLTDGSTIGELKEALEKQRQDMPKPPRNATCGGMFKDIPRRLQNASFDDVPVGLGNRTCPMGRRGRMDELMFGI